MSAPLRWDRVTDAKVEALTDLLIRMESVLVAFSGGTDSSFLAAAAHQVLGRKALAVTALSASYPNREKRDAVSQAQAYGWAHRFIETHELRDTAFAANPTDRCYYCKSELFSRLRRIADAEGFRWVADGSNTDDLSDYRPGSRAKCDLGVRSPLQEAGFSKADIRAVARMIGLETADKPASACLASRIPYGTTITVEILKAVERAEDALLKRGYDQLRVRAHGDLARIELNPRQIERAALPDERQSIVEAIRACGFRYVALDLAGYRMGSLNESLAV